MAIHINFHVDPTAYAYVHMANHLRERIETGDLKRHTPLPAERRLAEEYGVSLGTARRATEELRRLGLVYTLRSKGTYVGRLDESTEQPGPHADQG
jgi:DNA-binding GntR family transcriptional regulator